MEFLVGILGNLISDLLSSTSSFLFQDLTNNVKWKKWKAELHLSQNESDFLDRYAETLIALKKDGKPKELLQFYVEEAVISIIHDYWYGAVDNTAFEKSFISLTNWFTLNQQLNDFSPQNEIAYFLKSFRGVVNLNRTAGDTEMFQKLTLILESIEKIELQAPTKYLTNIPSNDACDVIGREAELQKLRNKIRDHRGSKSILVQGIGGIGKTTFLMAFAQSVADTYNFQIWLDQPGNFTSNIVNNSLLLNNLGIESLSGNSQEDTLFVLNKISNLVGQGLFIIDNAGEDILAYKAYFPKNCHTIVSSREELDFSETIAIGFLNEKSALQLFYKHYGREQNDGIVNQIVRLVDYHTLAIELVSKTAHALRITPLNDLLLKLEERGLKFAKKVRVSTLHSKEEKIENIFGYLCSIFDLGGHSETEKFLLKQFSVLLSKFISFSDIEDILFLAEKEDEKKEEMIQSLDSLSKKGWLIYDKENDAYKMHLIIQEVVTENTVIKYDDIEPTLFGVFNKLFIDQEANENPLEKVQWIPFSLKLLELFRKEEKIEIADLENSIGEIQKFLGNYQDALEYFSSAISKAMLIKGKDNEYVAKFKSNLGLVYSDMGHYEKALKLLEESLEIDSKIFQDNDHLNIITRKSNLATVHRNLENYDIAEKLIREVLDSDLRIYGNNHAFVAMDRANLASILRRQDKLVEAKNEINEAVAFDSRNNTENYPNALRRKSIQSHILFDLGEYQEALEIRKIVLDFTFDNYGERHPDVAEDYKFLSEVYYDLNEKEKAKIFIQKAIDIFNTTLGAGHHKTQEATSFQKRI